MKKKLEAELISIAHRILQMKEPKELQGLYLESRSLYEKIAILNFANQQQLGATPTLHAVAQGLENYEVISEILSEEPVASVATSLTTKTLETPEVQEAPEFIIDQVNEDISADLFVPATTAEIRATIDPTASSVSMQKNECDMMSGTAHTSLTNADTIFEASRPKSLNEELKKNISIGLNDRLAFIKHLFGGNSMEYNRVLSQLNTFDTNTEIVDFIRDMVKPEYNNWEGKEDVEDRFLSIIAQRFL